MIRRSAFLVYSNRRYWVRDVEETPSPLEDTPVVRLIESIWDHYPEHAFHLLRSRIYTNYPLSLRCRGAVQLAAKRVTELSPQNFITQFSEAKDETEVPPAKVFESGPFLPISLNTTTELPAWMRSFPFATSDRPILAVLTDPKLKPLLAATNSSSTNRLRHAEVNLVREYVKQTNRKIPNGFQIWVSLKPCRMCSGFIHDLSEDGAQTTVRYLQDDPGPKARHSPLIAMRPYP